MKMWINYLILNAISWFKYLISNTKIKFIVCFMIWFIPVILNAMLVVIFEVGPLLTFIFAFGVGFVFSFIGIKVYRKY